MAKQSIGDMRREVETRAHTNNGAILQSNKDYMDQAVKDTSRILEREGQKVIDSRNLPSRQPFSRNTGKPIPQRPVRKTARGGGR